MRDREDNVQIAVENYFIVHGYVSNDRTDYNTLIPVETSINTTVFCMKKSKNTKGKKTKRQLRQSGGAKNPNKGLLRPKIGTLKRGDIPVLIQGFEKA